ncbi:MAG TPA: uroporphyrinogen-III C-methyltransferase [Acidimicrobiales bacterium]
MTVYLVGAGPGDPGLLTLRGAELLRRADVVVHDRLADPSLLDLASPSARRVDVGKAPGGPVHQDEINSLLVSEGRAGRTVVRLKGGDPFVFGRGGEEALALQEAGVEFEIVPGITSAVAAPAYAGVPVTHRGLSTSFTVVTGHSRHAVDQETNWDALARAGGTIVVLMGVAHRGEIAKRLMDGGLAPETPVMAVHWGTRPEQASVRVRLDELGETHLEPPVTMVIGSVSRLDLRWYEAMPLFGKRVVITRARAQASALGARLRELGARPVEVPAIRVDPPTDGGAALARAASALTEGAYGWVVFTSANAVDALMERIPDSRALGSTCVAAVGPATAEALRRYRIVADLVPDREHAEGLLEAFPDPPAPAGSVVLFPRASEGREVLVAGLELAGWEVDLVEAYRTVREPFDETMSNEVASADAVCFASSSSVTGFLEGYGRSALPPVVACIGPATAETARRAGLRVDAVADPHTIDGLIDVLIRVLGSG